VAFCMAVVPISTSIMPPMAASLANFTSAGETLLLVLPAVVLALELPVLLEALLLCAITAALNVTSNPTHARRAPFFHVNLIPKILSWQEHGQHTRSPCNERNANEGHLCMDSLSSRI